MNADKHRIAVTTGISHREARELLKRFAPDEAERLAIACRGAGISPLDLCEHHDELQRRAKQHHM